MSIKNCGFKDCNQPRKVWSSGNACCYCNEHEYSQRNKYRTTLKWKETHNRNGLSYYYGNKRKYRSKYLKNKQRMDKKNKEWKLRNKEKISLSSKIYRQRNKYTMAIRVCRSFNRELPSKLNSWNWNRNTLYRNGVCLDILKLLKDSPKLTGLEILLIFSQYQEDYKEKSKKVMKILHEMKLYELINYKKKLGDWIYWYKKYKKL